MIPTCFSVFIRDKSELINKIVKKISTRLHCPLRVAKHPVGIYSRVIELKSILNLESKDGVLMVGLWGQGGIGKTCLAKALYNDLFRKFDGACFLANVGETSKGSGEKMLLLPQKLKVSNVDEGINLLQRRLCHKKVLLILDNVDALCQLDTLAGKGEWFGNGSRIIVTTRNKQLLTCHKIDQNHVYKVKVLDNSQAHELLSKHAFQTDQIRIDLVDRALNYAKGLPLALEVLGSLLCDTTEDVWESTIKKLSRNPNKDINNVLKVSFDGLDKNEKEIFLHIACFFKGWASQYTRKVLDSCDHETIVGFDILVKRSLIRIEGRILKMHDLIQAMGIDIVNQECEDDPGRRSRLWLYDDVVDVLSRDMDFQNLEYINFNNCESIVHVPDLSSTPNLKELDFRNCKNLVEAHESVAYLDKLQVLNLRGCSEFSVFPNVLKSKKLRALDICYCTKFERFPDIPHKLEGLKEFKLEGTAIKELPASIENLVALEEMYIYDCKNLEHLPSSIYKLQNLKRLAIRCCKNLIEFPKYEDLADPCMKTGLSNLLSLDLGGCNLSDVVFLENLSCFPLLSELSLAENNIATLPASITRHDHLFGLEVENCHQLQEIPKLPPALKIWLILGRFTHLARLDSLSHTNTSTSMWSICWVHCVLFILPEGEMPQWVVPIEEGSISFMVSKDLYDKILGLVFCFIVDNAELEEKKNFDIVARVNGESWGRIGQWIGILDSDHIFINYVLPWQLWREVDFAQSDGCYIQFGLKVMGEVVKKWGFRIICKQLGEDLKAEIRDNQSIDAALLYEVDHGSTKVAAKSSHVHEDNSSKADLQEDSPDCQTSAEEYSQIGSKRKHEVNFSLGKRIKTMLTSIFDRWR
ncbi:hypothetical protein BT93_E1794 [Corymbia citriodora subsp. variegata]|nr:hypothetical protein BT93_E1794 [Corymbia citriodora subsp. variegata]